MQRVVPGSVMSGIGDAGRLRSDVGRHDGPGGFEGRVRPLDREVLVQDPQQAPEVGVAPFAPRALALLDDRVDRALCRRQVGDGDELLPAEVLLGRLGVRRPDEQALGAKPAGEVLEAGLDRPVELADRVELLQMRDDLVALVVGQRDRLLDRLEALGILDVHPLRPLEEREVAKRGLAEGQQLDPDAGRIAVARASGSSGGRGAARRRRP